MSDEPKLIDGLKDMVGSMFAELKEVEPAAVFIGPGGAIGVMPTGHLMDNKALVWGLVRKLRTMSPWVAFMTEAWTVHLDGDDVPGDIKNVNVVPSEHPDRVEVVMVTLYEGATIQLWQAKILRSGDWAELDKWEKLPTEKGVGGMVSTAPPEFN